MLAEFLAVIPQTPSLVLITYRPEYRGALSRVADAQIAWRCDRSTMRTASALAAELLGDDPSIGRLAARVAHRAAGNPFFAEEMVRDLAERGVLQGDPGAYLLCGERRRRRRARHVAGHHRGAHRPARFDRQTHPERRGGDRVRASTPNCWAFSSTTVEVAPLIEARTHRPGEIHPARRVRLSPSADSRGRLRITAQVRSRAIAPASGRRDRTTRSGLD